jgi:hypothetical protein
LQTFACSLPSACRSVPLDINGLQALQAFRRNDGIFRQLFRSEEHFGPLARFKRREEHSQYFTPSKHPTPKLMLFKIK